VIRLRHVVVLAAALALAGCSGEAPESGAGDAGAPPVDSITDRQRDSAIGASGLPGARGVQGALEASDAAAARAAALDSLYDELP
jgi:hypothetical protein